MHERRKLVTIGDHWGVVEVLATDEQITRIEARMWNPGSFKLIYSNGATEMFTRPIRFRVHVSDGGHPNANKITHVLVSSRDIGS